MKKLLKISNTISFPVDVVTQTLAFIGRKGAGKTYLASMVAEQMLDIQAQVVVIDPVGNWWGLRVGADGKSKGKDIFVIGGEHGDVPLVPEAGARIAQLLVEKSISAVIDVSQFRLGEHKRFVADFGEEFFHLKKTNRSPVHVFVEEAQKVIPQQVRPEEARMVGAFEQIVRLGRNYGIGCSLITQRPQSVNKEVLSQVECLCVLQVTGPHERKALEYWVQEAGADRKLVGELPSLARGEGYVWSPSWLRIYERVHFAKKQTFDASATPEVGKATKAARLSSVDVKKLREDIADVVQKAEADDPVALKRKIKTLESRRPETVSVGVTKADLDKALEPHLIALATERNAWELQLKSWEEWGVDILNYLSQLSNEIGTAAKKAMPKTKPGATYSGKVPATFPVKVNQETGRFVGVDTAHGKDKAAVVVAQRKPDGGIEFESADTISGPEQRILNAIAWFESIGISEPAVPAVAFLAGYSHLGSAFRNPRGSLRKKGLIDFVGENLTLTETGKAVAEYPDAAPTQEELHAQVFKILPGPESRLLRPLIKAYPGDMSMEELGEASEYSIEGSAFRNPRGKLNRLGLISIKNGRCRAADLLFP